MSEDTTAAAATEPLEPAAPPMKGRVITTATHCLRFNWAESTCTRCMDVCPTDAITFDRRIIIDSKKCVECSLCANACPSDGILASMIPPENLYARIKGRIEDMKAGVFYITCSQTDVDRASDCVYTVPCLGAISPELWYALVRDFDVRAYLPDGLCLDCPAPSGADLMFDCVDQAQEWLGTDIPLEGSWRTLSIPENGYEISEADMFGMLVQRIGEASKGGDTLTERQNQAREERLLNLGSALVGEDAVLNRRPLEERGQRLVVTGRRRLILNVLGHHPEWQDEVSMIVSKTAKGCVACKECVSGCPVGARIVKTAEDGTASVYTDARHCVWCRQCAAICQHGGIEPATATGEDLVAGLAESAKRAEEEREEQRRLREQRRADADRRRNEAIERARTEKEQAEKERAESRAAATEEASVTPPAYEASQTPEPPAQEPAGGDE